MTDNRYLFPAALLISLLLHALMVALVWHVQKPVVEISAPGLSFVDLNSLDSTEPPAAESTPKPEAPAPKKEVKPQPKPDPKAVVKPVLKPVIRQDAKPDLAAAAEKPVRKPADPKPISESSESASRNNTQATGSTTKGSAGSGSNSDAVGGGELTLPTYKAAGLNNPPPPYPDISKENGEEGTVVLRLTVTAEGRATGISVAKSSGHARLDRAARNAVATYRFRPATRGGIPISYTYTFPFNFTLKNK